MFLSLTSAKSSSKIALLIAAMVALVLMLGACGTKSTTSATKQDKTMVQLQALVTKSYPDLKVTSYEKETKAKKGKSSKVWDSKKKKFVEAKPTKKNKKTVIYDLDAYNAAHVEYDCDADLKKKVVSCQLEDA
jgi:hypothetical protein